MAGALPVGRRARTTQTTPSNHVRTTLLFGAHSSSRLLVPSVGRRARTTRTIPPNYVRTTLLFGAHFSSRFLVASVPRQLCHAVQDPDRRSLLRPRDPGRFAAREQPPLFGCPFRPARFGRSSACGHRALQTLRQPPRQRGHAQIPTGGADAVRAQQFFQGAPAVPRHSRRRFDPPPTAGGEADHWSSVGTGARWRHRVAIQNPFGGILRIFLGAGNEPPPLPLPHLALLGRNPGPAPPNQPPLPPNADQVGTARPLPQQRGTFSSVELRLCSPRRLAPSLPRHSTSGGVQRLVQGRR